MKPFHFAGLVLSMACAGNAACGQDIWLVNPQEAIEFEGEAGFMAQPILRARAVMPLIDILQPESVPDGKLKAPFAIAVAFRPQNDAPIDPSSFKVLYGGLKFDITSRLTQYAHITTEGFKLENANIPKGKHRLTLQIQDTKQRLAERELRIEVE
ncbi:hypothetical protein [Limnohabitans sp. Jir72]|uniref:hypothetical protein n=1 Tax=Limnohabitans sp. Jir72 TaxID=1977909 RepID=UPI000D37580A|nr:hypothetical protein [Limnohabitans sp. Jir72]PUE25262.1 hypothetical protein B9Z52_16855 [Limnohabitans sp. Jir72]